MSGGSIIGTQRGLSARRQFRAREEGRLRRARNQGRLLIVAAIACLALAGLVALARKEFGGRSTSAGCGELFGSFSTDAHRWPPACWRPYGPNSPFNFALPSSAKTASDSGEIVHYMVAHGWSFASLGGAFVLNAKGSRPVYWSQPTDPLISVICRGGYPCESHMRLRIPAGARPGANSDRHMTVVDQQGGLEYDFWRATAPARGMMEVSAGNSIRIGRNRGTGLGGLAEAAHLGLLGGLIRADELRAGRIDHALAITVPCEQRSDVWPAPLSGRADVVCPQGGRGPHLGSLLQLNVSQEAIAATGAPAWERAIMSAMARYGVYAVDSSSLANTMTLVKEDDGSFTSVGVSGLLSGLIRADGNRTSLLGVPIDVSKFRVVDPCVVQGGC